MRLSCASCALRRLWKCSSFHWACCMSLRRPYFNLFPFRCSSGLECRLFVNSTCGCILLRSQDPNAAQFAQTTYGFTTSNPYKIQIRCPLSHSSQQHFTTTGAMNTRIEQITCRESGFSAGNSGIWKTTGIGEWSFLESKLSRDS